MCWVFWTQRLEVKAKGLGGERWGTRRLRFWGGRVLIFEVAIPLRRSKTNPRRQIILWIVINRGPDSFLLSIISINSTMALIASISIPEQLYLCPDCQVQPESLHDLGPGPLFAFQTKDRETKTPSSRPADCRGLRVSGRVSGWRRGQGSQP